MHQASPNVGDGRLPVAFIYHLQWARCLCSCLTNADHSQSANATALLRPAKAGRGLGSEPGQTMLYCTWGFQAKDPVPKSSDPAHTPELPELSNNHGPRCGIWCDREHCQQSTNRSARLRIISKSSPCCKLIWALPLPFYFLDSCFSLIKYFFFWLVNSQQHWTQRITFKGSR